MRECKTCGKKKQESNFKKRKSGGRVLHCRTCLRKKYSTPRSRWILRKRQEWKKMGIVRFTIEDFDALLVTQSGRCAICLYPFKGHNEPALDHDHSTGRVRGLLCFLCNRGVGCFRDNPVLLRFAADYLSPQKV